MPMLGNLENAVSSSASEVADQLTGMLREHAIRSGLKREDAQYLQMQVTHDGLVPGFMPETPDEATGRILDHETGGLASTPTAFLRRFDHRYRDVALELLSGTLLQRVQAVL